MPKPAILNLAECTEFRQTLQARPPKIVHGTAFLVIALLGAAIAWAAVTRANLVVRAPGRVRPVSTPQKVIATFRGDVLTGGAGARVREVLFREGDKVKAGDVLIRLDTERLDNEIERTNRRIRTAEEELRQGDRMRELIDQQFASGLAKIEAELAQAEGEVSLAKERRASDIRLAEAELKTAQVDETAIRKLVAQKAAPRIDLDKLELKISEALQKIEKARLPVDEGKLNVVRGSLATFAKDHEVKLAEVAVKQEIKRGEIEAARLELANLELERRQAVVKAPISGVITSGDFKPGDTLESGKPVVEIAEQTGYRFELAVPAGEMDNLKTGMPVRIKLDAYDYQRYGTAQGVVTFVAADSTTDQEKKVVAYVVKVQIDGDEVGRGEFHGPIKLGLTGQAEIVTGNETLLKLLLKKVRRTISLG